MEPIISNYNINFDSIDMNKVSNMNLLSNNNDNDTEYSNKNNLLYPPKQFKLKRPTSAHSCPDTTSTNNTNNNNEYLFKSPDSIKSLPNSINIITNNNNNNSDYISDNKVFNFYNDNIPSSTKSLNNFDNKNNTKKGNNIYSLTNTNSIRKIKKKKKKRKKKIISSLMSTNNKLIKTCNNNINKISSSNNFKVIIRVRPPLERELQSPFGFSNVVKCETNKSISICDGYGYLNDNITLSELNIMGYNIHSFTFDYVYSENDTQKYVYNNSAKSGVLSVLKGYNATIIAYGQTSAGKTYTMEGFNNNELRGIIPRSIEDIFEYIQNSASKNIKFLVRASYLQIYNEIISDLLKPNRINLNIRESKKRGFYVEGLSEWVVTKPNDIYNLIKRGAQVRATCETKLNQISSRSHAIFMIIVEQTRINDGNEQYIVGKLNLVDLAGSERVRISGAEGLRLEESCQINKSLSSLGNVIAALTDKKKNKHIPYRNSKLTKILQDSLGGNCKTTMMAMISPALEHYNETFSTLKFANRAKNIKNNAKINQDLNEKTLIKKYEKELKRLRIELQKKQQNVVDKNELIILEQQKNQAIKDKILAMNYLDKLKQDLMKEKKEKEELMLKIKDMSSSFLIGSHKIDSNNNSNNNDSSNNNNCSSDNNIIHHLNNNINNIDDDNEVKRYKELLIKQRDIMIKLTEKLNERDQSILHLQDELDGYDKEHKRIENVLDYKTGQIRELQTIPTPTPIKTDNHSNNKENIDRNGLNKSNNNHVNNKLEYILRDKLEEMVQKEVDNRVKQQNTEVNKWREKYENAEERRKNTEYLLELSKVGANANILQKQLSIILKKERERVEHSFNEKIKTLKNILTLKDKELNNIKNNKNINDNINSNNNIDTKKIFAELKQLKELHRKFTEIQNKVENKIKLITQNSNQTLTNVTDKNENINSIVKDLQILQVNTNNNSDISSNDSNKEGINETKNKHQLRKGIENKIHKLVDQLSNKIMLQKKEWNK